MTELKLTTEQVQIVLESLSEEKVNCYVLQRKQLINLEINKSISKEEYDAFVRFTEKRVELIEYTRKSILEQCWIN